MALEATAEAGLAAVAWRIASRGRLAALTSGEQALLAASAEETVDGETVEAAIEAIRNGGDPLGEAFMRLRPAPRRRQLGAVYTPAPIVAAMVGWVAQYRHPPARIVDAGCGSGRFLLAAAAACPQATLLGVEIDPLAALLARANLTAAGLDRRARIVVADFLTADLDPPGPRGPTAYLSNPPYVRHHRLPTETKRWLAATAAELGVAASGLCGLHAYFVAATALRARAGDLGAFVTSAEWLDVNYGHLVRQLVAGRLGGVSVHLVDPAAVPFPETATTAAVTCFETSTATTAVRVRRVADVAGLGALTGGKPLPRRRLLTADRWTPLTTGHRTRRPAGYVELGELCRVHRGAVTGANRTWLTSHTTELPEDLLVPAVTRARELFDAADSVLSDSDGLRSVICLPADLDTLSPDDRDQIDRFLAAAASDGVPEGYIASRRNPWWSLRLREPAPILATYMARRPPAFVQNTAAACHINIAHGIYPRDPMTPAMLAALAAALRSAASTAAGRTYAGGLVKFEPSEMSRICVPGPEMLAETVSCAVVSSRTPRPSRRHCRRATVPREAELVSS